MKFLYDFFPVVLFFLAYKLYGHIPADAINLINNTLPVMRLTPDKAQDAIYLATAVGICAAFLQVSLFWLKNRRFEKMHLISFGLFLFIGGITIALKNPVFIKWKPTIINWAFATAFLGSQFIGKRTLVERMMGHAIQIPVEIWGRLNLAWVGFFIMSGLANIYVAYNFSESTWVDFKLFGLLGLTFIFVFAQAFYLARYIEPEDQETHKED